MQTVLSLDATGTPIHPTDIVLYGNARIYQVLDTENSFILQGFLRSVEARWRRGKLYADGSPSPIKASMLVVIDPSDDPRTTAGRRTLYRERQGR
jgi:hypothetical protein